MGRKINVAIFCIFYCVAGCNHFAHPGTYIQFIPPYLTHHKVINYVSGSLEVICAQLMLFRATRKIGMYLTILLLLAFIPAHIYMIQLHGRISREFSFPAWVAWVRLFPLQFVLIWWAYKTWALFKTEEPHEPGSPV